MAVGLSDSRPTDGRPLSRAGVITNCDSYAAPTTIRRRLKAHEGTCFETRRPSRTAPGTRHHEKNSAASRTERTLAHKPSADANRTAPSCLRFSSGVGQTVLTEEARGPLPRPWEPPPSSSSSYSTVWPS